MPSPDTERLLREITDRRLIHEVLLRLASAIDRNDRESILSCYHEGALDHHGEFDGTAEQFADWVGLLFRERVQAMSHQITNHRVEIDGDTARSETYVMVFLSGKPAEGRQVQMIGVGRYLDRFERRDGEWRIAMRTVLTDWQQAQCVPDQSGQALITQLNWGLASREDPSYAHLAARRWPDSP